MGDPARHRLKHGEERLQSIDDRWPGFIIRSCVEVAAAACRPADFSGAFRANQEDLVRTARVGAIVSCRAHFIELADRDGSIVEVTGQFERNHACKTVENTQQLAVAHCQHQPPRAETGSSRPALHHV